jgi:putative redox protein
VFGRRITMKLESERVTFEGATGAELAGRLDHPQQGTVRGYALFAHCFTCSKDVHAASRISKALAERGMATLRFDFTGLGHSGGEFASTDFSSNVRDLVAAGEFMEEQYAAPDLLVGHSLGGAAVLSAAGRLEGLEAVATIAAPCHPSHVRHLFDDDHIEEIRETGEAEVTLAGRTFRITREFLDDLSSHQLEEKIGDLDLPLLLFHGPRDQTVGIDNAARIFEAAKHPKSFVSLDDADHLLSRKTDARYVATVLSAWGSGYLDSTEHEEYDRGGEPERPEIELESGQTYVGETGEGKFSNHVLAGEHYMRADEPDEVGGDNTGATPYDFLTGGLGACTSMTLRMYADRKGWPVDKIEVRLHHEKVHASDCETCETDQGKIDRIERRIAIEGDLDDEQRQRMVEIADKCPVHQSLTRRNVIETTLDEQS